jgi:hypothetical protein
VVPLFPTSSYIGSVSLNSYDGPGQAAFGGTDTVYYAVTMHLTTSEYTTENVQDAGDDGEMDLAVALANQDETNIDDFVEGVTDPDVDYQYP